MKFTQLVSKVFYSDIKPGLNLFVDCLGFKISYDDLKNETEPFCVIGRDGLKLMLVENAEFAEKDRPEIRLETDDIDDVFAVVSANFKELLHPNLSRPTLRPWGAKEFALLDSSGVCIVICQWMN